MRKVGIAVALLVIVLLLLGACAPAATPTPPAAPPAPEPAPKPEPSSTQAPVSEEAELKHDDGTQEGSCSAGQGLGFLVHFSPPTTPFLIHGVKLFTSLRGSGYENQTTWVEIRDRDLEALYSLSKPVTTFSADLTWITMETPDIPVNDDFYIVFYPCSTREGGVYLHFDLSQTNNQSETVKSGSKITDWVWEFPKDKTNWMMRVIGESTDEVVPVPTRPFQIIEGSPEFQETVSSLNSPEKLSQWMIDNIQYESHYEHYEVTGINYIAPPDETFETKLGCCAEFSVFACYVLQFHNYQVETFSIKVESDESRNHVVCVYHSDDLLYSIDNGRIKGSYETYEDIASDYYPFWSEYDIHYSWDKKQKLGPPDKVVYNNELATSPPHERIEVSPKFKEVVSSLDTPEKVSRWVGQNIKYKSEDINEYAPAWVIFERGYDDCDGFATIQSYFLKANGYDAWSIGIAIETLYGHNVCGYKDNGKWFVLDTNGIMRGPFESLEQLADEVGNLVKIPKGSSIYLIDPFDIVSTTSFPKYEVYRE